MVRLERRQCASLIAPYALSCAHGRSARCPSALSDIIEEISMSKLTRRTVLAAAAAAAASPTLAPARARSRSRGGAGFRQAGARLLSLQARRL